MSKTETNHKLEKRGDGWWVVRRPREEGFDDCGPYATKQEAEEIKKGFVHTAAHWDDRSFWTTEKIKR